MRNRIVTLTLTTGLLAFAGSAVADHNSKNGEGWANMPNDIHNMRIETREANDNEAFRNFVQYGAGAKTENRFATDETPRAQANGNQVAANVQERTKLQDGTGSKDQARKQIKDGTGSQDQAREQAKDQTGSRDQSRLERRSRLDTPTGTASRMSRSTRSSSAGTRRGGGRKK